MQKKEKSKLRLELPPALAQRWDLAFQSFRRRVASYDALPQLAFLGILSGLLTGAVILLFRLAIEWPLSYLLPDGNPEAFEGLSALLRVTLPLCGALTLALVLLRLGVQNRKVGVAHVMERLGYHQGYISLKSGLLQFFCGIMTIVSGQSAGREGPAVHLGATASSLLGQRMRLPNNSIRMLVGCGTAAAVSASFNTPIAGVIFAMEVVMLDYTINGFTPIILAAVTAAVVSQSVYGDDPAFIVPGFSLESLFELPYIVAAAILISLFSVLFVKVMTQTMTRVKAGIVWKLLLAGLITGTTALAFPEVMGIGYDTVNQSIAGTLPFLFLITIALMKLLVTATTIGLGMPSGIIGPTLFIGATLGGALGVLAQNLMPTLASEPGFYAVLGMGAMMGSVLQAPLAAIMAVIELTRNPNVILPTMLIIILSSLIASHYFKQRSVFLAILQLQGLDYKAEPLTMALRRISVGAIMERSIKRAKQQVSWAECQLILKEQPKWIVIEGEDKPRAVLPAADLARYLDENKPEEDFDPDAMTLDLLSIPAQRRDAASLHIQATLEEALQRFNDKGVEALYVERTSAPLIKPIIGVITRAEIDSFYRYKAK
ncbi:chloride channel protein [Hahella ganghwensis]|uniref:chloride channel protein n=1 Tax=Hahella ganghwensis TaxID=286420 RepID=UPI00037D6E90|nr:chloride channel protein [Hahella ganghwensis]